MKLGMVLDCLDDESRLPEINRGTLRHPSRVGRHDQRHASICRRPFHFLEGRRRPYLSLIFWIPQPVVSVLGFTIQQSRRQKRQNSGGHFGRSRNPDFHPVVKSAKSHTPPTSDRSVQHPCGTKCPSTPRERPRSAVEGELSWAVCSE